MAKLEITNSLLDELRSKCQYYQMEHDMHNSDLLGVLEILKFDILETCFSDDEGKGADS